MDSEVLSEIGNTLLLSNSFKSSIKSAISKIHDYLREKEVFLSLVKDEREKIVCGIGERLKDSEAFYNENKKHSWLQELDNRNLIFLEKSIYKSGITWIFYGN